MSQDIPDSPNPDVSGGGPEDLFDEADLNQLFEILDLFPAFLG